MAKQFTAPITTPNEDHPLPQESPRFNPVLRTKIVSSDKRTLAFDVAWAGCGVFLPIFRLSTPIGERFICRTCVSMSPFYVDETDTSFVYTE